MEDYVHRAGRTGRAGNKGTCITFLAPDQDKLAVDILRAMEASGAFIPDELRNMSDGTSPFAHSMLMVGFLEKIKSGKAKASNGGFKGKGLERFDKKREEKNNAEKATYGDTSEALSLSSREGAVIPYKPKTNEYKPPDTAQARGEADYTFTEIKVDIVKGPAPDKAINPALYGTGTGKTSSSSSSTTPQLPQATLDALKKARAEGRNVDAANLQKVIARLQQAIDLGMKNQPMSAAVASSFSFSSKPKDPDATDYHAIFPINDYPQKARWKATNKEQMTMLSEISGASITMRGVYYPPGEDPPISGEPKLHLLLESNDEMKVKAAIDEIRRNLVEASMLALDVSRSSLFLLDPADNQNADRGGAVQGRYSV
jgi:ATP-dependent RNA helicase DDX46/PRP5